MVCIAPESRQRSKSAVSQAQGVSSMLYRELSESDSQGEAEGDSEYSAVNCDV